MAPEGFLPLLKPPGMTSHDVVAFVRSRLGLRRAGHLGTLDPAAAGLLPVAVGRATRLFRFAVGEDKAYRAEITFGLSTTTMDAEGAVTSLGDSSALTRAELAGLMARSLGDIEQVPPAFSAVIVRGQRAHTLARQGIATEVQPRRVRIVHLDLVGFWPGRRARALVDITCSAGTYVRVLAAELGREVGCGAYLSFLVRTRLGRFRLRDAITLEESSAAAESGRVSRLIVPPDWPLTHLPHIILDEAAARGFAHGVTVVTTDAPTRYARVYGPPDHLLGLGEIDADGELRPRIVLAAPEEAAP